MAKTHVEVQPESAGPARRIMEWGGHAGMQTRQGGPPAGHGLRGLCVSKQK